MGFEPQCTILRYRTCENGFTTKSTILPHQTPNDVWKYFRAFRNPSRHQMRQNLCFGTQSTIFGVPKLRKWFPNEINHSPRLDPKRCLRVFRSISQTFNTSNKEKLVFPAWMPYFRVPNLWNWFRNEINHSTKLDTKWFLIVFQSIS